MLSIAGGCPGPKAGSGFAKPSPTWFFAASILPKCKKDCSDWQGCWQRSDGQDQTQPLELPNLSQAALFAYHNSPIAHKHSPNPPNWRQSQDRLDRTMTHSLPTSEPSTCARANTLPCHRANADQATVTALPCEKVAKRAGDRSIPKRDALTAWLVEYHPN